MNNSFFSNRSLREIQQIFYCSELYKNLKKFKYIFLSSNNEFLYHRITFYLFFRNLNLSTKIYLKYGVFIESRCRRKVNNSFN